MASRVSTAQLAEQVAALTELIGGLSQDKPQSKPAPRAKSTAAKMSGVRRNLDPVRVEVGEGRTIEVRSTSRDGKMLTAPRAYVIATDRRGNERAARSFTLPDLLALHECMPSVRDAFGTVSERAFPVEA